MSAEFLSAVASLGTLVVVIVTAAAAFVQLRHMSVSNRLMVLNSFREEYERLQAAATDAMALVREGLGDPETRIAFATPSTPLPTYARPLMPLIRLFEMLGIYTNRNIVSRNLVCDAWAPVIASWWTDCAPMIAVMRRGSGPAFLENWEAIAVVSQAWLERERSTYPKGLRRMQLVDPWADVDATRTAEG